MIKQVTGDFWDSSDPKKPFGLFDPDDDLEFPFICNFWVDADNKPIDLYPALCTVDSFGKFNCQVISIDKNVMLVRIKKAESVELVSNKKYPIKVTFGISDGQHHDKTFWLKISQS